MNQVGLIGGTGIDALSLDVTPRTVDTPYGPVVIEMGQLDDGAVALVRRHGSRHTIAPNLVNYRGNVWALHSLGIKAIIGTAAVGSLGDDISPGTFVVCDQFLDFTHGRPATFADPDTVVHTDVTHPYCPLLRRLLLAEFLAVGATVRDVGCYVCTEGPRYETAAESRMFRTLGGDVVGMTGVPEAVLARELGICYATVAVVTNYAPGLGSDRMSHQRVEDEMKRAADRLGKGLARACERVLCQEGPCPDCSQGPGALR